MTRRGRRAPTGHRNLLRGAHSLRLCAASLDVRPAAVARGEEEPAPEAVRVRRLLLDVAGELERHATLVRRLDDEIELLRRRRHHGDARHLDELERRRARSQARLEAALDGGTRALLPGGDALDPATILHRLCGASPAPSEFAYFGRPAVDRADRVRRLAHLLRRGVATGHPTPVDHRPAVVVLPPRASRLAGIRHRLLRSTTPAAHTTGAAS
ncbi:hypothetical protein [Mobilicoccus pelagius]|uniref:Uncharacterized protein n=1 Tax=Mobilicoccus pelagius NBRC 104925 TaxID=1089455 RepID=H5USS4_9MICO|nr:hypothetical protein [Mobilicoccus pelagius]GAB48782.1 hypothetical protein MOPEL_080_00610 [Mobilicoccus pelagius NBRC 104925]